MSDPLPQPPRRFSRTQQDMPKQPAEIRARNFDEVALGYTAELAMAEAQRCLTCKKPQCVSGCPVENDIPTFLSCVARGDFHAGIQILKKTNCLPAVSGRVCPQEEQCEGVCILQKKGSSVAIGRVERFLADWEASQGSEELPKKAPPTGRRVAVVGSGPAGLTAAGDLILLGHDVTVFEALHELGGVLVYGIPEFRLPKAIVRREVEYLRRLGVRLVSDYVVGKTRSLDSLLEAYDAVFIGAGAGLPWLLDVPGKNLIGVYSANEYLTRLNLMKGYRFPTVPTPVVPHHRVIVVGGGNVAMDCARSALRLGAEAHIVYRRSKAELPARAEEVENAEEEGVVFDFLTLPTRIVGDAHGVVSGIECVRMKLGQPDASGRRSPEIIPGSEYIMPADAVVCALGNSPNPLIPASTPDLAVGRKGNIVADEATGQTSKARVWAGGDVVTGAATVILAMGAGRKAARSIHEYLSTLQ